MSEIAPEKIRQFLDLELGDNDSGERTARGYLLRLLGDVWRDGEGFDGKRPFGNSSWDHDLYVPMVKAGLVDGKLDSDGYIETFAEHQADALVHAAIAALDAPREDAPGSEPAKVIVVTEPNADGAPGRETRYNATQWDVTSTYGLLALLRSGHPVALFQSPGWLSVREDGATVPDTTGRQLARAKRALRDIAHLNVEDGMDVNDARAIADRAVEDIAELDL